MLNIPTAKAKQQQPGMSMPGGVSSSPESETALSQTTPYQYAGQGWNDPIAQDVMRKFYEDPSHGFAGNSMWNPGGGAGFFDRSLQNAQAYNEQPGVYHTNLDPSSWGTAYKGDDYNKIAEDYKAAGGTYFDQFTPAQQAGVPYYAATGEAAPVMNMQTGVAENPLTKQQMPVGGTGSSHSLLNNMWR